MMTSEKRWRAIAALAAAQLAAASQFKLCVWVEQQQDSMGEPGEHRYAASRGQGGTPGRTGGMDGGRRPCRRARDDDEQVRTGWWRAGEGREGRTAGGGAEGTWRM